jgi:hypothetical protein
MDAPLPGFARQSIPSKLASLKLTGMDARIKPGHDNRL